MPKRKPKRRTKSRKRVAHRSFSERVLIGIILVTIVFVWFFLFFIMEKKPDHPLIRSKKLISKDIENLNGLLKGSIFSLGLREKAQKGVFSISEHNGSFRVTPYREDFILPGGLDPEILKKRLNKLLDVSGYKHHITFKEHKNFLFAKVSIDGYTSHILYFYYPEKIINGRVVIVIDDIGNNLGVAMELINMEVPITLSILPFRPYSDRIAQKARDAGRDVLLHLPMEPKDPANNPGKGALFTAMSLDDIRSIVNKDILSVPYVVGVNNHMGSKFSEDAERMRAALEEIRDRSLFFLDSRTSKDSKGFVLAQEMGMNAFDRNVFLDNERDIDYIKDQLEELARLAEKHGFAIAIGHPHEVTIAAIKEMLPFFEKESLDVVPLSYLVEHNSYLKATPHNDLPLHNGSYHSE